MTQNVILLLQKNITDRFSQYRLLLVLISLLILRKYKDLKRKKDQCIIPLFG